MSFDTTGILQVTNPMLGYLTGTSTPTVTFNGAAVGVTYTIQTCNWTTIGDRLFLDLRIVLSSKGSSSGLLAIDTNVPAAYASQGGSALSVWANELTAGVGAAAIYVRVMSGGRTIQIGEQNTATGGFTEYSDASLKNTAEFRISGSWRIAR